DSTHAYQYIVFDFAAMDYGIVPYRNVITYNCGMFFVRTVNYSTILYVYFITNTDRMNIAPNYSIEPYTAFFANCNIANNSGIFGNKTIVWYLRIFTVYFSYNHII